MDIKRKFEFSQITPEKNITYKIAVTINDKKARDKLIKGPLDLRTVLETIELHNYNRKYGDKKQKNKKPKRVSFGSSSIGEQVAFTRPARKPRPFNTEKKKLSSRNCHFCRIPNWTPEHICPARKSQGITCKTGHFARVCKSKTVNRIQEENETDSNTVSWPEVTIFSPSTASTG